MRLPEALQFFDGLAHLNEINVVTYLFDQPTFRTFFILFLPLCYLNLVSCR